jgi:hypothetical protein
VERGLILFCQHHNSKSSYEQERARVMYCVLVYYPKFDGKTFTEYRKNNLSEGKLEPKITIHDSDHALNLEEKQISRSRL